MAESAALLVDEVFPAQPVRQWVLSVPYALRFLFANEPAIMGAVLGIVHRCLAAHLIGKAGLSRKHAQTGAVTLIQRFGGALNLNVHFHMLVLDGVYVERPDGTLRFRRVAAPTSAELNALTATLAHRIGRFLERRGIIERDAENAWLVGDDDIEAAALEQLRAASITYRIALGPRRGKKAFTLQTLPPVAEEFPEDGALGLAGGFSLHAGIVASADERSKLAPEGRKSASAATSLARRLPRNASRSPRAATSATTSRRPGATAPPTSCSSRWTSSLVSQPSCRSRG